MRMSFTPYDYTVQPDEPDSWADYFEFGRQLLHEQGKTEHEIHEIQAPELAEMRSMRHAETLAEYEAAEADLIEKGILDDPTLTEVEKRSRQIAREYPLMRWSEFRDQAPDHTVWLVEGILAEGQQCFIGAPAKYGKTWVAGDLAVSVATGTPFLKTYTVPTRSPVIYLALEGQLSALRTRFGCLARAHGVDPDGDGLDHLHLRPRTPGINLADPAWSAWIINQVRETGAKLLIIDVLRKAMPLLRETGDGATDFSKLIANLAPIAELGCAIEFLHHFLKRSEGTKERSVLEMLVGSGALGGHADSVIGIGKREKEGQLIRTLGVECDGRDEATPEPFTIRFDGAANGQHGGWCYTDTLTLTAARAEPKKPRVDRRELKSIEIITWIAEQPGRTAKPSDIRAQFGLSEDELGKLRRDYMFKNIDLEGAGPSTKYVAKGLFDESL